MSENQITVEEAEGNLLACAAYLVENIRSSEGYAEAMKHIIPRYLEKGDVDFAAALADTVDDPFARDRLLSSVAEKCAALDDDEYAFQLVEAVEDYGSQTQARERIALQKADKGDFQKALSISETLEHADDAYAGIAARQAIGGDETGALQTLEKIDFPNARVNALQNIAAHFLEKGEAEKAAGFVESAAASAEEIEMPEEKVRFLSEIAVNFTEAGRSDKAIEILERAGTIGGTIDNTHRDALLANVALGFLRAGSLDLADRTLDEVKDKTQLSSCLVGFAREFWRKGEQAEALEILEEAYAIMKSQRDAEIRDSRARFGLWAAIAIEFARFEKAERAIEIAQENISESQQTASLIQIAQICTSNGKDELARQAINAIADDAEKMFALIAVSDAKNRLGEREQAVEVLNEARALCETVHQLASRSAAFNEFSKRFTEYGETEKARAIVQENLETIAEIRDDTNRVAALAQLSDVFKESDFELNEKEREILKTIVFKASL